MQQSASHTAEILAVFIHLHSDIKVLAFKFDVLFFTFLGLDVLEWGTVKRVYSSGQHGAFSASCHIFDVTLHNTYTAVKAAKGHIVLCVCAELLCSMTNERGPSNCWNTVALPILWVRMDVPSRGGGDGSMHLADSWWKVKIVSITLLWPSKQQPLTHTHARTPAHTLRSLTLKHYS